jgi:hypothetical protein
MNRTIDVRTEMRKLATSKPVHAAAGAGVLAGETLRELPARLARWRNETNVTSLSSRATGYVLTARDRAVDEYDKLARRGRKALNGRGGPGGKGALNGKAGSPRSTRS